MTKPGPLGLALIVATLALLAIALRLAWVGDDAYITLRTVENLATGHGARWNIVDRVQTFTHPLWMLVLTGGRLVAGEVYHTTIVISLAATTAAIVLLLQRATTIAALVATAMLLAGSRAFGDYTTSGLETPLTFLLLTLFVRVVTGTRAPDARIVPTVLLMALLATNRMDLVLIGAPATIATLWAVAWRRGLAGAALGSLPFVAWLAFATIYYGNPLPVTAHAKIFGVGIPASELARQGLYYLWTTLRDDPVTSLTIVTGITVALRERGTRWLGVGALLYLLYVVKVGGDFMAGRFCLPPFVVAVATLAPWLSTRVPRLVHTVTAAAMLLMVIAARGLPAWLRAPTDETPQTLDEVLSDGGICDERRFYQPYTGLFAPTHSVPEFESTWRAVWPEPRTQRWLLLSDNAGIAGFRLGRSGHLVDRLLCDPLLTRLPVHTLAHWRIGHVRRRIPEGYWETLRDGENRVLHRGLHDYVAALRTVTQAPLLAGERLAALWQLSTGAHDAGFRAFVAEHYLTPPRVPVALSALPPTLPAGALWFDEPRLQLVYEGGVAIGLDGARAATVVRAQALGTCAFHATFRRAGQTVGDVRGAWREPPPEVVGARRLVGLRDVVFAVPATAAPFDELWIDAVLGPESELATGPPAIGAVTFEP